MAGHGGHRHLLLNGPGADAYEPRRHARRDGPFSLLDRSVRGAGGMGADRDPGAAGPGAAGRRVPARRFFPHLARSRENVSTVDLALVLSTCACIAAFIYGVPIVLCMGLWIVAVSFFGDVLPLSNVGQSAFFGLKIFALLAMPLFI